MSALSIYAGSTALKRIQSEGLHADQFKVLVGAGGGPKWFVLFGLDRYLYGEFFATRSEALYTLGSSAGAWRMCCLAISDPIGAIERLASLYSGERYSDVPTVAEITESAGAILKGVLGTDGIQQIVENPIFRTHILAARCKGLASSNNKLTQKFMLASSAIANSVSRKSLSLFFQRTVFNNMGELSPWSGLDDIDTQCVSLTEENLFDAMMASGAIPFVLEGIRDIAGAQRGLYWDGGIVDYHFDLMFNAGNELVLYPHFSDVIIPGWFDKHVPWRNIHEENFHNVVLVTPSPEWVSSLPGQKIPDRQDFALFDNDQRIARFQEALDKSNYLAEEFAALVERGVGIDRIQPLVNRPR